MKSTLFILLLLVLTPTAKAQILYQTGLENWTSGTPDGMVGSLTDLPQELISEETDLVHGGLKAMRLSLGILPEVRLSTEALAVEAGELYDIRFWLRGNGRVRTGINDGRLETSGYAPYNTTVVVNGQAWQQVVQTVYVTNTSNNAEFIFAVEGTSSLAYLVIDDITISNSTLPNPTVATISEIQETTSPFGYSPLNFQFVRTSGIVTGVRANTYFLQDGSGPWNGIQVFYPAPTSLSIGDSITVMATVTEFQGEVPWLHTLTQLIVVQQTIVHSSGNPVPAPVEVPVDEVDHEQWEGVLVRINDLQCMSLPEPELNEWTAANWQGSTLIDDLLYLHSPSIGNYYTITGIAQYDGERKILPRSAADFEAGVGVTEMASNAMLVYPNPASNTVTIELTGAIRGGVIQIHDLHGSSLLIDQIRSTRQELDISALAEGLYFLSFSDGRTAPTRFVITR